MNVFKEDNKINISIIQATNAYSKRIIELITSVWVDEYQIYVNKKELYDLHDIEGSYFNRGGCFFIAVERERIVGTIACEQLNNQHYVLKRMFVLKEYRGSGIAQKLLDTLVHYIDSAAKCSVHLFLSTDQRAVAAKRFYSKNLFKEISKSELPKNFPYFYGDDVFMVRNSLSRGK